MAKQEGYLSSKEARRISRENRRIRIGIKM